MTIPNLTDLAAGLTGAEEDALFRYPDGEAFDDGDGPEATAQRLERKGLAYVSAWKGGWKFRPTELALSLRNHLQQGSDA